MCYNKGGTTSIRACHFTFSGLKPMLSKGLTTLVVIFRNCELIRLSQRKYEVCSKTHVLM
jgi:hypothetical protein